MKEATERATRTILVPGDQAPIRIDRFLSDASDTSRTAWQRSIRGQQVRLNGALVRANDLVQAGDRIEIIVAVAAKLPPMAIPRDAFEPERILYQDDALLVVNKPKGLVVHPSRGHTDETLVHYLLPWLEASDESGDFRPGIVHRLDKDTTGCLVVARTSAVKEKMTQAISQRLVDRWYLALCEGKIEPRSGIVDAPVGRDRKNRVRMAVERQGRAARTHFTTLAEWPHCSLVLLKLETGRTHQIRVHLSSLGHPLVGDGLYGGRPGPGFDTQALHAWRLGFAHPLSGERLCLVAPLPESWTLALAALGAAESFALPKESEEGVWRPGIGEALMESLRPAKSTEGGWHLLVGDRVYP